MATYHFIPIQLGEILKSDNSKCWGGNGSAGGFLLCWWKCDWNEHFGKEFGIVL